MSWSRIHRWLALVLALPLVVWSITGLLFHLKPGWSRAYDMLSAERPLDALPASPVDALAAAAGGTAQRLEIFGSALGPLYRVTTASGTVLLDAQLHRRSPLSPDDARTLAADAIAHSSHHDAYGAIGTATVAGDSVHVAFANATSTSIARAARSASAATTPTASIGSTVGIICPGRQPHARQAARDPRPRVDLGRDDPRPRPLRTSPALVNATAARDLVSTRRAPLGCPTPPASGRPRSGGLARRCALDAGRSEGGSGTRASQGWGPRAKGSRTRS